MKNQQKETNKELNFFAEVLIIYGGFILFIAIVTIIESITINLVNSLIEGVIPWFSWVGILNISLGLIVYYQKMNIIFIIISIGQILFGVSLIYIFLTNERLFGLEFLGLGISFLLIGTFLLISELNLNKTINDLSTIYKIIHSISLIMLILLVLLLNLIALIFIGLYLLFKSSGFIPL